MLQHMYTACLGASLAASGDAADTAGGRGDGGTGVEDGGEGLDALDKTRARPHDEPVGVDRPYRDAGQLAGDQLRLRGGAVKVEPAGSHHDNFRLCPGDLVPACFQ